MAWVMVGTAAVGLVTSAYSANQQKKGAQGAANAARDANNLSIEEQRRQFDAMQGNLQPYIGAGNDAMGQMQALNSGDFSSFNASPDYQFALQQGFQGLDRGAAARGGLYSGGHTADTINYGQGMASQQYGNFYSKLDGLARMGQASAAGVGAAGMGMANSIGNLNSSTGNALGGALQSRADANSQFATGVGGMVSNGLNQWGAQRASSYAGAGSNANFGNNITNWSSPQGGSLTGTQLGGNPFAPRG